MQFKNNKSLYSQIIDYIKLQIFSGELKCGEKLWPIRELALNLKVNPNTIVRAYTELENECLIYTKSTNGKFVCTDSEFIQKKKYEFIKKLTKEYLCVTKECNCDLDTIIKIIKEAYNG